MNRLEHRIPPPVLVFLFGVAMSLAARFVPTMPVHIALRVLVGVAAIAWGFSWVARGYLTFRDAGTTIDPVAIDGAETVVTHGPFARSRNPMYVGFTAMVAGWAAVLGAPALLAAPVLFALFITRFQIVPEERAMRARFGAAYTDYTARVPRWL
jgi:protein-S-isoprenylcysteine O-methyltransferase Ste14